jgi:hypothetical protein
VLETDETGKPVVNPETGEQQKKAEYKNFNWPNARFVGSAAEQAKTLKNGNRIDIVNGWIENSLNTETSHYEATVIISAFSMSEEA